MMKRLLVVFAITFVAGSASAERIFMYKDDWAASSLSATAINSAAYTGWQKVGTKRSIAFEIAYTNSAGTAVTMTCQTTNAKATANGSGFDIHSLSTSSGTSTSVAHTWSNAVSGNENWTWTVANLPHDYINCAFTATGGDGNDKVTVRWRGVTP